MMVNSHENTSRKSSNSRRSGSSRGSIRQSHRSSSRKSGSESLISPINRSDEPRRIKRGKEDLMVEAKEKASTAGRSSGSDAAEFTTIDHTGAVIESSVEGRSIRNLRKSKRGSHQQDRGIAKDAATKAKDLTNRPNEPNTGPPPPGAHASSRGDEVAKVQKSGGKGRFSRPLGTQSVYTVEEHVSMEAEYGQEQEGLVSASAVDESHDPDLAMTVLNSMLDQMEESDNNKKKKSTKNTNKTSDIIITTNKSGDSSQESNNEEENEESDEKDWEKSKLKKGVRIFRYLCCVIVLAAAGIGTWIASRDNNNSMSDTTEPLSGGVPNTPNPSPNATSEPTGDPNSNTGDEISFEPPSEEDCAAITNGGKIEGQDTMPMQSYVLALDATPLLPMDLSISAGIIKEKVRGLLTPALTGCDRDVRNMRHRHRHLVGSFSYAIANVMVDAFGVEGLSCVDVSNPQCHRVSVTLDIVVKDESVKVAAVITELSLFFGGGVLANKLELSELYESIVVANLGSTDQTKSPSKAPSAVSSPTLLETPIDTYDPPSLEDCIRIRSGFPVEGQEDLETRPVRMAFDVKLSDSNLPIGTWVPAFKEGIDKVLIPALAGCPIQFNRRLERLVDQEEGQHFHDDSQLLEDAFFLTRGLQEIDSSIRYAIANANANAGIEPDRDVTDDCEVQTSECNNVRVILELFLKGEEKGFEIITLIAQVLQYLMELESNGGNRQLEINNNNHEEPRRKLLARIFGCDPDVIESVKFASIEDVDPTTSPSISPSQVPSIIPTAKPSRVSVVSPSVAPTTVATGAPATKPTEPPTKAPTRRPNPGLTPPPTRTPTPRPTPGPTPPPTRNPTPPPTIKPTYDPYPSSPSYIYPQDPTYYYPAPTPTYSSPSYYPEDPTYYDPTYYDPTYYDPTDYDPTYFNGSGERKLATSLHPVCINDETWKDDKGRDCSWYEAYDDKGCPKFGFDSFTPCSKPIGFCYPFDACCFCQ